MQEVKVGTRLVKNGKEVTVLETVNTKEFGRQVVSYRLRAGNGYEYTCDEVHLKMYYKVIPTINGIPLNEL